MKTILSFELDQITHGVKNFIMIGPLVSEFTGQTLRHEIFMYKI
jgi:hypothetical protein